MTPPGGITNNPNINPINISPNPSTEAIDTSSDAPQELASPKSSFWKTLGRIGLGIVTGSLSELIPLAWKGIKWICSKISGGPEREAQVPANQDPLPQARPEADKINQKLARFAKPEEMPTEYRNAINEALSEMRQTYGGKYLPEGKNLAQLFEQLGKATESSCGAKMAKTLRTTQEPVTPEAYKDMIQQEVRTALNHLELLDTIKESAADKPLLSEFLPSSLMKNLLLMPGMDKIATATSPEQIRSITESIKMQAHLEKIEQSLQSSLDTLREIFGDAAPKTTREFMNMLNPQGQPLSMDLSDTLRSLTRVMPPEELAGKFTEKATEILSKRSAELQVQAECKALGVKLPGMAVQAIAVEALASTGNTKPTPELFRDLIEQHLAGLHAAKDKYLGQVGQEFRPLFERFISDLPHTSASAGKSDAEIAGMLEHMKTWRPIQAGDAQMKQINEAFLPSFQDYYSKLADAPGQAKEFNEDSMFSTMLRDSKGMHFNIDGDIHEPHGSEAENFAHITQIMKQKVPDDVDRQFLSKLLNQSLFGDFTTMIQSIGMLPNGQLLSQVPGGNAITFAPLRTDKLVSQRGQMQVSIVFSEDRQTARITGTVLENLQHTDGTKLEGKPAAFGMATHGVVVDIRLGSHPDGRGITNVQFTQSFSPLPDGE